MSEVTVNSAKIARLAYGYELMFRAICEIAGTSGGSTQWFTQMGIEVQKRVDPLWKLLEDSNAHRPGDCLSQYEPYAKWASDTETSLAVKYAEIEKLKAVLIDVQYRLKNARGAVESNQVVDKDVHGTLTRAMTVVDAALKGDAA